MSINWVDTAKIVVTHTCNLSCPYCSDRYTRNKCYTNVVPFYQRVDMLCSMYPNLKTITLYGGEPTLDPELDNYVSYILENTKLNIKIFTNGILFPSLCKDKFTNNRLWFVVTYSSDSYSQLLRGNIDSVQRTLEQLKNYGAKIILCDTLAQESAQNIYKVIVKDFQYTTHVGLNMVTSERSFSKWSRYIPEQLAMVTNFLADNPNLCFSNYSTHAPTNPLKYKQEALKCVQGVSSGYKNGIKNIVMDIDSNIYDSNRSMAMGIKYCPEKAFFFSDECSKCDAKYSCTPNFEHENSKVSRYPFIDPNRCVYEKALHNERERYFNLCLQKYQL